MNSQVMFYGLIQRVPSIRFLIQAFKFYLENFENFKPQHFFTKIFKFLLQSFKSLNQNYWRSNSLYEYLQLLEKIDFPVQFSGQAIENWACNSIRLQLVLTFDQQNFWLETIFSIKSKAADRYITPLYGQFFWNGRSLNVKLYNEMVLLLNLTSVPFEKCSNFVNMKFRCENINQSRSNK